MNASSVSHRCSTSHTTTSCRGSKTVPEGSVEAIDWYGITNRLRQTRGVTQKNGSAS